MTIKNTLAAIAFGLTLTAASTFAQSATGTLRGTVLDPSGALIPHAQITVTNANGFTRTLNTSSTGTFELPRLAPGTYSVSVDALGFTPALEGDVQVVGQKVTAENIKLGISVASEIDVNADDSADASGNNR